MVGTSFPYAEWLPEEGSARGVEIDIDGRLIGMRYPDECNLVGDAKDTLQALIPLLRARKTGPGASSSRGRSTWRRSMDEPAPGVAQPMNPQPISAELAPAAGQLHPDLGLRVGDELVGTAPEDPPGNEVGAVGHAATMCPAVPYALARFAFPERPVIASTGTGRCRCSATPG